MLRIDIQLIYIKKNCYRQKAVENIVNELHDYYKDMPGFSDSNSWFIFSGYKPMSNELIKYSKDKSINETKIAYFIIHDLRHSHVAYLIKKNINIYKISKRLGHSLASIQ